ncbi:MAG TPA: hypothetical protein VJT75_00025 [Thermoleophilaceae bacterium]|nr:hypothetical protein [Thermoleophilaceae bacterium]
MIARRMTEYTLIALIFGGSLALWLGIPALGLWLVSKLSDNGIFVAFAVFGIFCPVAMGALGLVLGRLNGAYYRVVGIDPGRSTPAWRSSLSGERGATRKPRNVLEVSLTLSVIIAIVAMAVWFLFFAHSPNPAGPAP